MRILLASNKDPFEQFGCSGNIAENWSPCDMCCSSIPCGGSLSFEKHLRQSMVPKCSQKIQDPYGCFHGNALTYLWVAKIKLRNLFFAGLSSRARRGLGSRMTWTSMQKKTQKKHGLVLGCRPHTKTLGS